MNPSWQLACALDGERIAGHAVHALLLPTRFRESLAVLRRRLRARRPAICLCLGLAEGRVALSLERVAINVDDARIADNAGRQPVDAPVVRGAPAAYFSTLPIKAMVAAIQGTGVPAEVSQTAGTFVCNHVFFGLMHELAVRDELRSTRGGFMHLPWLESQGQPSISLADASSATRAALACALTRRRDLRRQGGRES